MASGKEQNFRAASWYFIGFCVLIPVVVAKASLDGRMNRMTPLASVPLIGKEGTARALHPTGHFMSFECLASTFGVVLK